MSWRNRNSMMLKVAVLTTALVLASSGQARAITATGLWLGGGGIWSDPLRWGIACPQVPPPLTPDNTATCLFTVNITGPGSDVQSDLSPTVSVLNVTGDATLSVNLGLTSLINTLVGSGSDFTIGPVATFTTGAMQNDGLLELDELSVLTAVSLLNTDKVTSSTGTFTLGSLVNDAGATFEIDTGLTTIATTLIDNDGLFDLTATGANLTGSLTALEFDGSGEAVLGDAAATLTAIGNLGNLGSHTLRGFGSLSSFSTVNQGDIEADVTGETLSLVTGLFENDGNLRAPGGTLDIDAAGVTHTGTLEATGATGKWEIDATDVDNDASMTASQGGRGEIKNAVLDNAGGIVSAASGSSVAFEDTNIENGQLTTTGSGFMTMAGVGLLQDLTANADLTLLPGSTTFVSGTIVNQQRITLSDGAGAPGAGLGTVLDGAGTVELTGDSAILGSTIVGWTNEMQHTVEGFGLFQTLGLLNNGLIRANQTGETLRLTPAAQIQNRGTLQATGSGLLSLEQADIDNEGGVIEAQASSFVDLSGTTVGSTLRGGQLTGAGELRWSGPVAHALLREPVGGAPATSDINQRVVAGGQLSLDDFVNEATVAVEAGAFLLSAGGQSLWTGSGDFLLEAPTSTLGSAAVTQFTHGAMHTIHGQGLLQGFGAQNNGTIRADQAGTTLEIALNNGTPVDDLFNQGFLRATNGATLRIDGTDVDNDLGVIEAEAGSTVAVVEAEIHGGQLTGAGEITWEGTTNALRESAGGLPIQSDVSQRLLPGSYLFLEDFVNEASITVEGGAFLLAAGGVPDWLGSGEFLLESATSTIGSAGTTQFTNGPMHTIRGQGLVQGFQAINEGTITADQSGQTLELEMSNSTGAPDVTNNGLIQATNAATLRIDQTDVENAAGVIQVEAGSRIELADAILRGGTITGAGEYEWVSSGTLGDPDLGTTYTDALHRITGDYLGLLDVVGMQGTVINDGRIVVEADGLFTPNSGIASHFLNGSGSLEMHGATSEVGGIIAGVWTQGPGHRLEGFGIVKAAAFGNNGILAPGLREAGQEIGAFDLVISSTDLGVDSVIEIELAGTTQGTGYDFIDAANGLVDLGGVLDVRFHDSFESQVLPADVFTVLTANTTLTGTFSNVANGTRMTTSDGFGTFLVHFGAGSLHDPKSVVLSDFESNPDFGDAPDSYKTLLASNGARHLGGGALRLGTAWDAEPDGQVSGGATGDGGDEDGVAFTSGIELDADSVGALQIDITASAAGRLDAWIDFNADGDWDDFGEQIFTNTPLAAGVNSESFTVMNAEVLPGNTFARFRLSSAGGLGPDGEAADGEVEDYEITIKPVDDLDLMNRLEISTRTFWACNSIVTGLPGDPFTIQTGADITLHAGNVVGMRSDSEIQDDAMLTVQTGSVPGCP